MIRDNLYRKCPRATKSCLQAVEDFFSIKPWAFLVEELPPVVAGIWKTSRGKLNKKKNGTMSGGTLRSFSNMVDSSIEHEAWSRNSCCDQTWSNGIHRGNVESFMISDLRFCPPRWGTQTCDPDLTAFPKWPWAHGDEASFAMVMLLLEALVGYYTSYQLSLIWSDLIFNTYASIL